MDPKTFAAARAERLTAADIELEPFVRDALERYIAGDPNWSEDLVLAASVLWLEHFEQEAPYADPEKRLAAFQESVVESLSRTSEPESEVSDGQVQRVTYWLSGYTVNNATVGGTAARGGKFKRWVSHHDDAVRETHEQTDGQTIAVGATFVVGGYHLHYPGEPVGPPEIWINCRCLAMGAALESASSVNSSAWTYLISEAEYASLNLGATSGPDPSVSGATGVDTFPVSTPGSLTGSPGSSTTGPSPTESSTTPAVTHPASTSNISVKQPVPSRPTTPSTGILPRPSASASIPSSKATSASVIAGTDDRSVSASSASASTLTPDGDQRKKSIEDRAGSKPAAMSGGAMSANTYVIGPEDQVDEENPDIEPGYDVFAVTDPDDIAVETADEEDLVPDEPEDGEELITEIPVHGVLAPEGVSTGDGRKFAIGALSTRDLPIPLRYESVSTHGGQTSDVVTVGRIDEAWRDDASDAWRFRGVVVLTKPFAQDVIDGIVDGTVRGTSIDGDDAEVEVPQWMQDGEDGTVSSEEGLAEFLNPGETVFSKMRVAGLTIVAIPAFQEAYIALGHEFQEDLSDAEREEQVAALQACGCMDDLEVIDLSDSTEENARAALEAELFRDVDTKERKRLAGEGAAMPDGSYPIANCDDLRNAIQAIGRAKDPEATKRHIRKRKSALGCDEVELPDTWSVEVVHIVDPHLNGTFAPGTHDGPGWITHPVATARIRRYWTRGAGAGKIKWGAPGDFNRCRRQLAKYVQNPDWLAGLCANMHYEALGFWPAQHHGARVLTAAASGLRSPVARLVEPEMPVYPHAWFSNPGLDRAVPLRIEKDTRRTYGYVAQWGTCHVGMAGFCQDVPKSYSEYGFFLKGIVDTDAGEQAVGCLTFGGHAGENMRLSAAAAYYDKPDAVRAFVNVGEDEFGIWFAGVIPPDVSDADIAKMRGIGAVSGDWREIRGQLELIGVPIVNTPGFPQRVLAASAGRQITLIGAGALAPEPETVLASAGGMDPELIAGIARTAVAEYRHQEQVAKRAEPLRAQVRARRLEAARARTNGRV